MSEEAEVIESAAPPEVQAEAEKLGWIPPTRYKGEVERFVDADEFIKRGETVLPIVKEQNRRLKAEIETVRGESQKVASALAQAQKAIEEIEERHTVATQKAVEKARVEVKAQLAAAGAAGDYEGVAELTDQLTQLNKADDKPEAKKAATPTPSQPVIPPEVKAWNERNAWFGTDRAKTNLAIGVAEELRQNGESSVGEPFMEKVKEITERRYVADGERQTPPDRVASGRNGSGSDSSVVRGKGYAALPKEAKEACESDAKRFVGDGKKYKTKSEWQSRYAEIYFQES